ncbi:MAG: hypothetical protein GC179_31100 [Anaerolineaceae bacterium]|nr:hypothetical protein [Anaerolineaceae bacterium]
MRQWIIRIATLSILLCGLAVSTVQAAPASQERFGALESLSAYFPKDTMLYVATRTDTHFVASLDRIIQAAESQLPQGVVPPQFPSNLTTALDLLMEQSGGGTFAGDVRPWLEDTLAVGIYPAVRSAGGRIVIKINNAKAAADAALKILQNWTSRQAESFILLAPTNNSDHNRIAVYSDVMIIYSWSDDGGPQPVPTLNPNVTANPYYTTALSRLPESSYDMIAFVDTPLLIAYTQRQGYHSSGDWIFPAAVYRTLGSTGFGLHVGTDQTLTLDVVQTPGNVTGLDALDIHFTGKGASLTPDILRRVPRNSVFVAQAADVGSMLEFVGSGAQSAAKKFQTILPSIITGVAYGYSASSAGLVSGTFGSLINTEWANVFFSNLSGYDYTSEIRPLLSGSSALFLTFNPSYNPTSPTFVNREPFDGALLFEAADAQTAHQFVTKLQRELAISIYSSGDDNAVRIQEVSLPGGVQGMSLTIYGQTGQPFDQFIVANQDNLLVMGTTRAVNQVLSGDGLGFVTPTSVTLPDAGAAFYLNLPPAQSPEWTVFTRSNPNDMTLRLRPNLVQSVALTAAGSEQNDLLMRLTVTLPCGDNCG